MLRCDVYSKFLSGLQRVNNFVLQFLLDVLAGSIHLQCGSNVVVVVFLGVAVSVGAIVFTNKEQSQESLNHYQCS